MGLVHDFNKELSLWFNAHGITNLEFVEGEDFCYYHNQHVVQWGMFETPRLDANFRQFFHEYGLEDDDIHIFMLSLLHEVGHYMTLLPKKIVCLIALLIPIIGIGNFLLNLMPICGLSIL